MNDAMFQRQFRLSRPAFNELMILVAPLL
jgi:hypothetical protein